MSGPRTSPPRDLRVFELSENDLFASWLPRKIKYYTLSVILKHLLALVRCIAQFFKSREVEGSIPAHKSERKKISTIFKTLIHGDEVERCISSYLLKKLSLDSLYNVPVIFNTALLKFV